MQYTKCRAWVAQGFLSLTLALALKKPYALTLTLALKFSLGPALALALTLKKCKLRSNLRSNRKNPDFAPQTFMN